MDTAGRLQINKELMKELEDLKKLMAPQEILLVADAMLGQQAVSVAEGFHGPLGLTGLIFNQSRRRCSWRSGFKYSLYHGLEY